MLRAGQILQLVVMALLGLAVVMVHSASMRVGDPAPNPWLSPALIRTAVYAALAVAAMFLASRFDVRELARNHGWNNPLVWVMVLSLALVVLAMVPHVGAEINGARRWLRLGPAGWPLTVTFQPSELVKWAMILVIAWWCVSRGDQMHHFGRGLLPALALLAIACLIIVKEDLGTAALIAGVAVILLLAGGARWWHLVLMVPPAAGGVVLAIIHSPYRRARLTSFLNPFADARGTGYQIIQSLVAIAEGGPWGRGPGNSMQKFGYLPSDTTDFIFAVICEELGVIGAILVVLLYLTFLWVGLSIVRRCKDPFGKLVVLGVTLTVGLQALINMAVVTDVVPTKGIALPLVSSGGTGWIVTAFAIGLVCGIDRAICEEEQMPEQPAQGPTLAPA